MRIFTSAFPIFLWRAMLTSAQFLNNVLPHIEPIVAAISLRGGRSYAVGGAVRDLILGRKIKDIDIEVHNLTLKELENILLTFGPVSTIGKKFGVLRIHNLDVDWSIPRHDSLGRKPTVITDPKMTPAQACRRRDITINALMLDLDRVIARKDRIYENIRDQSYVAARDLPIIDPYGGIRDIENKTLRAVDPQTFVEDPLRFYRVMQFIARFEMHPDDELNQLCATMKLADPVTKQPLPRERITEELSKMLLKSKRPSLGLRWIQKIGRLAECFPELEQTASTPQRIDYHPEGTVLEHCLQTLDASARIPIIPERPSDRVLELEHEKLILMLAALCHDLGKAVCTDEHLHAYKHEHAGVKITQDFLNRFSFPQSMIQTVCCMVKHHMEPFKLIKDAKPNAFKKLAHKIAPQVTLRMLALLALCDQQGRNAQSQEPLRDAGIAEFEQFIAKAQSAEVFTNPEEPVVKGRDLLDIIKPGPELGKALDAAYQIQINEDIRDKKDLIKRILASKRQ